MLGAVETIRVGRVEAAASDAPMRAQTSSPWQKCVGENGGLPSDSRSWNPFVSNNSAARESVAVPFFRVVGLAPRAARAALSSDFLHGNGETGLATAMPACFSLATEGRDHNARQRQARVLMPDAPVVGQLGRPIMDRIWKGDYAATDACSVNAVSLYVQVAGVAPTRQTLGDSREQPANNQPHPLALTRGRPARGNRSCPSSALLGRVAGVFCVQSDNL